MASDPTARVLEVRALAQVLWFLPAPARAPIADKLHGLGVRVHPELATLKIERTGPAALGNHAQQEPVKIDRDAALRFMRGSGSQNLADMADRIEAADTDEKRAAEAERLKPLIDESIRTVTEHVENTDPGSLG